MQASANARLSLAASRSMKALFGAPPPQNLEGHWRNFSLSSLSAVENCSMSRHHHKNQAFEVPLFVVAIMDFRIFVSTSLEVVSTGNRTFSWHWGLKPELQARSMCMDTLLQLVSDTLGAPRAVGAAWAAFQLFFLTRTKSGEDSKRP